MAAVRSHSDEQTGYYQQACVRACTAGAATVSLAADCTETGYVVACDHVEKLGSSKYNTGILLCYQESSRTGDN